MLSQSNISHFIYCCVRLYISLEKRSHYVYNTAIVMLSFNSHKDGNLAQYEAVLQDPGDEVTKF